MKSYHEVLFDEFCEHVQKSMANKGLESPDEIPWDVGKVELLLYFAMIGRKPVGVNRNFTMLFIHDRFSRYINREVYSKPIWDHLDSMYDMAALHESEILLFPSEEIDFELPEYFDSLVMEKFGVALPHTLVDDSSQTKNDTSLKSSRKMSTSKLKTNLTPLINKTKEMPYIKPSNTSTLIPPKSGKTTHNLKSDEKLAIAEIVSAKNRPELPVPAKISKNKRSSSPFSSKSSRSETAPSREESPDIPVVRKPKPERSGSPANMKKAVVKSESPSTPVVGKKAGKEQSNSSSKHVKSEVPDSNVKKVKNERDSVGKKGKLSINETPGNKKSGNSSNGTKKVKSEPESNARRSSDSSSNKQLKVDVRNLQNTPKGAKADDDDSSTVTASRKSASVAKSEPVDSIKKRKRQKVEDSPKKMVTTSQTKRRRT